jgi:hypothetical protein
MTSIGVGRLAEARRLAQQRRDLHFYRQEDHLMVNWLLIADVLAGDWASAAKYAARFRSGWERTGRLSLGGFALAPSAVAMMYALQGDDDARQEWLDIAEEMGRGVAHQPDRGRAFGALFDSFVELHRGEIDRAVTTLSDEPEQLNRWHTGVWRQWYAAAWAETGVLAGLPTAEADERRARARAIAAGNPIASAIVDRADALAGDDTAGLLAAADALAAAGCIFQQARTLVLAGRDDAHADARAEGERLFAEMAATPMVV